MPEKFVPGAAEKRHNIPMPSPKAPSPIYQLKITLTGITPPIWRRIQVPSSIKLCCLHSATPLLTAWISRD